MFLKLLCPLVRFLAPAPPTPAPAVCLAAGQGLGAAEPPRLPKASAEQPGQGSSFSWQLLWVGSGLSGDLRAQTSAWPGLALQTIRVLFENKS